MLSLDGREPSSHQTFAKNIRTPVTSMLGLCHGGRRSGDGVALARMACRMPCDSCHEHFHIRWLVRPFHGLVPLSSLRIRSGRQKPRKGLVRSTSYQRGRGPSTLCVFEIILLGTIFFPPSDSYLIDRHCSFHLSADSGISDWKLNSGKVCNPFRRPVIHPGLIGWV